MFATILGPYPREAGHSDVEALRVALEDQLDADLGVLADGAATCAEDALASWRAADAVARELAAARGLAPRGVKARMLGPYTAMLRGGHAGRRRRSAALAAADAGNAILRALIGAGAPLVQVEEDGLADLAPDAVAERGLASEALRRLTAGVVGHLSLSIAGGDASGAGVDVVYAGHFSSHYFDIIEGPDGWRVAAGAPRERGLILGVADCRSVDPDDEAVSVWAGRYAASLGARGTDRIGLAPSAGLERLPRPVAQGKLAGLAEAATVAGMRDRAKMRDAMLRDALSRGAPPGMRPVAPRRDSSTAPDTTEASTGETSLDRPSD